MGILFTFILAFSHCAFAQDYMGVDFTKFNFHMDGQKVLGLGVFDKKVPSFDEIAKDQYRFNNYEQFLDYLLHQAPSLAEAAVLLHHSQSLQVATPEHPRVLLFDGGSVFAFAENPEQKHRRVEMVEVNPESYEVSLKEIVFGERGIEFNAKPNSCTACHGSPAKLLWDPYDFWPGAYGSSVGAENSVREKAEYQKLVANSAKSPLLSRIQLPKELIHGKEGNTPFTEYVGLLNFGRWWKSEVGEKNLDSIRYPMLATLSACFTGYGGMSNDFTVENQKFLDFFKAGQLSLKQIQEIDQIYQDTLKAREHFKNFQDRLYVSYFPNPDYRNLIDHKRLEYEQIPVTHLRFLFGIAGIDISNLSTSLMGNDFFFSNPGNFLIDALTMLYKTRPELFEGLRVEPITLGMPDEHWIKLDCEELKKKSLENSYSRGDPIWTSFLRDQVHRPALSRCAKCHTEGLHPRAPLIPFHDSAKLAARLKDPNDPLADKILFRIQTQGPGRMPYQNTPLSPEEIAALKEFIASVQEKR